MDQIGTSHIATADLLVCGVTLCLILFLRKSPSNSIWSRVVALLCGCAIFAVIVVLVLVDLDRSAVSELSFIAITLCVNLWQWNDNRVKSKVANAVSPANLTN